MRLVQSVIVAAVLIAATSASQAQTAYDYPWCALRGDRSGGQSCYFTSYRQCMQTLSGIGGTCIPSPYYRGPTHRERRGPREYDPRY
jgi:hypothetical protein